MKKFGKILVCVSNFYLGLSATVDIDTRFGYANSTESYVFDSQQTFTDFARGIGDVEFRAGLVPSVNNNNFLLGATPPLSGTLQGIAGINSYSTFYLLSDLTFGDITLNQGGFGFIFTTTSSIFLTHDLKIVNSSLQTGSLTAVNATLDGRFNRLILAGGTAYFGVLGSFTLKNISIEGISGGNLVAAADLNLYNVTLVAYAGQSSYFPTATGNFLFQGPNNYLGYGGTLIFAENQNTIMFAVDAQSQLHVLPGTTLGLAAFPFGFVLLNGSSSTLFLDNCTLNLYSNVVNGLVHFHGGTIIVNGNVNITNSPVGYVTTGIELILGDGINSSNNCDIQILPGSKLIINDGVTLVNKNI